MTTKHSTLGLTREVTSHPSPWNPFGQLSGAMRLLTSLAGAEEDSEGLGSEVVDLVPSWVVRTKRDWWRDRERWVPWMKMVRTDLWKEELRMHIN